MTDELFREQVVAELRRIGDALEHLARAVPTVGASVAVHLVGDHAEDIAEAAKAIAGDG